jgi:hypothetical protein
VVTKGDAVRAEGEPQAEGAGAGKQRVLAPHLRLTSQGDPHTAPPMLSVAYTVPRLSSATPSGRVK